MKTNLGVAATPPAVAALIAGAVLLSSAFFLPSCRPRSPLSAAAPPVPAASAPAVEGAAQAVAAPDSAPNGARRPPTGSEGLVRGARPAAPARAEAALPPPPARIYSTPDTPQANTKVTVPPLGSSPSTMPPPVKSETW